MFKFVAVIFAVLATAESVLGGLLHGESYAPAEYAYAGGAPYTKLAAYSSPLASSYSVSPLAATYAGRYAAHSGYAAGYGAVPLTASYAAAAPIAKYTSVAAAPLASYAAAVPSYSASLLGHGSYGTPVASYGGYGSYGSYGSYAAPLSAHGGYAAAPLTTAAIAAPLSAYSGLSGHAAYDIGHGASAYDIGHGASLSAW